MEITVGYGKNGESATINFDKENVDKAKDLLNRGEEEFIEDEKSLWKAIKAYKSYQTISWNWSTGSSPPKVYRQAADESKNTFDSVIYRMDKLCFGEWNYSTELDISGNDINDINSDILSTSFNDIKQIVDDISASIEKYNEPQQNEEILVNLINDIFNDNSTSPYIKLNPDYWTRNECDYAEKRFNQFQVKLNNFKEKNEGIDNWDVDTFKKYLKSGKSLESFIKEMETETGGDDTNQDGDQPYQPVIPNSPTVVADDQFNSSKTVEETNTNTETTDTGKTDTDKSDDNSSSDTGKTEPTKDTDTKDSDTTFENKPKPDNPPTISDNKGSSGVSHGGLSSNNGKGNYTFTNSGISASQDEPIEILTDEKPGDDQITSLPDDNEDIYTIPTDLSGVTSTKKHSSGGGSSVIPILGGLGAAAAVGVGAKIYMDNKKNNDNDEDSSESDDNTEDWNEASNENDGILADEWNEDDSNFEFDDSEPNMDDDESEFSEI